jgi:hypothetical protein
MHRDPVKSSQVKSIGYEQDTQTLELEFLNRKFPELEGAVYQYTPFSILDWGDFRKAESIGRYFAQHIRKNDALKVTKISPAQETPHNDEETSPEAPESDEEGPQAA